MRAECASVVPLSVACGAMGREAFEETVETIYRTVEDPAAWGDVLDNLLSMEAASSGSINVFDGRGDPTGFIWQHGFSLEAQRLYAEYFHRVDPFATIWHQPSGRAVLGHEVVAAAEFARSEIWTDYSRVHLDAFHLICASFPLPDGQVGAIGLHRGRAAQPFDACERSRLDRLLPHLQAALRLRQQLAPASGERLGFAVLDSLEVAVVVARADGVPVFANRSAVDCPVLRVGAGHRPIETIAPAEERRLLAAVRRAAEDGCSGAVLLSSVEAPVAALVSPLPPGLGEALAGPRGLAIVVLRSLDAARPKVAGRLRQLFGLTGAEAALALALVSGDRPEEIAAARGVRISTVRFQLRAILDKTGTRGQSDLVRLLTRLTPFRDDDESDCG